MKIHELCSLCSEYETNQKDLERLHRALKYRFDIGWPEDSPGVHNIKDKILNCEKRKEELKGLIGNVAKVVFEDEVR